MQIANPIYDVVFKYLMEDNKVAILLVSAIIEEDIVSLDFRPQERVAELENPSLTVYRLDFSAKIRDPDGCERIVLIELQKAKFATDIMRFRRYLGEQYASSNNINISEGTKKAIPIISIYFLGHILEHITVPLLKVQRKYYDAVTGTEIHAREEFVESLTHDSFVIQIPRLHQKYRKEVEVLLSVFDQRNIDDDHHILNVKEEDLSEKYRLIIRRLQRAWSETRIRQTMDIEDEILEELQSKERFIEKQRGIIEEKDKTIQEKDKCLEEHGRLIEQLKKQLKGK